MDTEFIVRGVTHADLDAIAQMAVKLVRFHQDLDPLRYLQAEHLEEGYRQWFAKELGHPDRVVLLTAARSQVSGGALVGYAYGRLEDRDWNALLDAHGALHDIWVEPDARRSGVATLLIERTCAELEAKGAPRVLLHTAWQNTAAHKAFERAGFRRTMIEMTREKGG